MNYKQLVYQYFGFSSSMTTNVGKKMKEVIHISGKPNFSTVIFYLLFCAAFNLVACVTTFLGKNVLMISASIVLSLVGIICVFIKSRNIFKNKEPKTTNINIYQRDLPSKLKPAHVRMLINDGLIDGTSLAATILDLIDNGYLEIEQNGELSSSKLGIFQKKNMILRKTGKSIEDLLKYEQYLIEWFIDKCGDGKQVSSEELHKKLCDVNNTISSSEAFQQFQALVVISFPLKKYYTSLKGDKSIIKYVVFTFLGFIPYIPIVNQFLGIYGLGVLFFANPRYLLNQNGVDEKDAWLDLKRYLEDFSDIENRTAEMVVLWEFYLTYSIALNIKSIASNEIEDFFGENIYFSISSNERQAEKTYVSTGDMMKDIKNMQKQIAVSNEIIEKDVELELQKYNMI